MSAPQFLVDECLPFEITEVLRQHRLDTVDLVERGLRGLSDREVWALAATESRILVTKDLDFPLRDPGPRPEGLVLLRGPDDATSTTLAAMLESLLTILPTAALTGHNPDRNRDRRFRLPVERQRVPDGEGQVAVHNGRPLLESGRHVTPRSVSLLLGGR